MSWAFSLITQHTLLRHVHLFPCLNGLPYAHESLYLSLVHPFIQLSTGSLCLDISHAPHMVTLPSPIFFQSTFALWIYYHLGSLLSPCGKMELLSCHLQDSYLMGRKKSSRVTESSYSGKDRYQEGSGVLVLLVLCSEKYWDSILFSQGGDKAGYCCLWQKEFGISLALATRSRCKAQPGLLGLQDEGKCFWASETNFEFK